MPKRATPNSLDHNHKNYNFWGRENELHQLKQMWELQGSGAHLIVCEGRRRIGKSYLIEHFGTTSAEIFLEFQGLAPRPGISNKDQLQNFTEQISRQSNLPKVIIDDWTAAFTLLNSILDHHIHHTHHTTHTNHSSIKKGKQKRVVILLDEISWMATKDDDFAGKLKIAWDTLFSKRSNLILILCGSITSWIENNILANTDFVGRVSLCINLKELPLNICAKFWRNTSTHEQISSFEMAKILSLTGGVPRYLKDINYKETAEQNIHRLAFSAGGLLVDEFEKIFNEVFDKRSKAYKKIIDVLKDRHFSFVEICKKTKQDKNGVISKYLEDLCISGFLERDYVYTPNNNGKKSEKFSRYRLKDNYLRFYLKYIESQKDKINKNLFKKISLENLSNWNAIMGLQFQNIILNNIDRILTIIKIDSNSLLASSPYFQNKTTKNKGGCQIDLLIETKNSILYVCEFKFSKEISDDIITAMKKKIHTLQRPKHYSVRPILIYGGNLSSTVIDSDYFYKIISLDELFI
ncbi:MAG: ATP-binding protein [Oligoflexia bacterium]|nr:ATP-binding protein [Oligoflexia bacterium]